MTHMGMHMCLYSVISLASSWAASIKIQSSMCLADQAQLEGIPVVLFVIPSRWVGRSMLSPRVGSSGQVESLMSLNNLKARSPRLLLITHRFHRWVFPQILTPRHFPSLNLLVLFLFPREQAPALNTETWLERPFFLSRRGSQTSCTPSFPSQEVVGHERSVSRRARRFLQRSAQSLHDCRAVCRDLRVSRQCPVWGRP